MSPTRTMLLPLPFCEVWFQRSLRRRTNFNPDQTSVTAQTFTSTSPAARPVSRTMFSVRSVGTPELFLGQLIQSMPAGASCLLTRLKSLVNDEADLLKTMAKSSGVLPSLTGSHLVKDLFSCAPTSFGASTKQT